MCDIMRFGQLLFGHTTQFNFGVKLFNLIDAVLISVLENIYRFCIETESRFTNLLSFSHSQFIILFLLFLCAAYLWMFNGVSNLQMNCSIPYSNCNVLFFQYIYEKMGKNQYKIVVVCYLNKCTASKRRERKS